MSFRDDLTAPGALAAYQRLFATEERKVLAFAEEPDREKRWLSELQRIQAAGSNPQPLLGVPVGVKDIFHVEGLPTRAGSLIPTEELTGREAPAVSRLRDAGAFIVGKTTTTEFAYFAPAPTRNPRALEHTPGGSSSGSAAAVASGLCRLAFGTQTIGSIGRPAAFCGVVGYKPSYDRVERDGVIPLAPSLDHVGLLAETLEWAHKGAEVLIEDWTLVAHQESKPRLLIPEGDYLENYEREGCEHFTLWVERFEAAGFEVASSPVFPDFPSIADRHRVLLAAEIAEVHREWYPRFQSQYRRETRELIEKGQGVDQETVQSIRAERFHLRRRLDETLDREACDLWLSPPATGPAPKGLHRTGDPIMNLPWTQAGVPTLVLPAGSNEGLPMGLQFAGRFGQDETLFEHARSIAAFLAEALGT